MKKPHSLMLMLIGLATLNACNDELGTSTKSCAKLFLFENTSEQFINIAVSPDFTDTANLVTFHVDDYSVEFSEPLAWAWFNQVKEPLLVEVFKEGQILEVLKVETHISEFKIGEFYAIFRVNGKASIQLITPGECNDLILVNS